MNKQELIERIEDFPCEASLVTEMIRINKNTLLGWVKELDLPQPIKLKDIIARIKIFDVGTQKVWLNEILDELGSDYGTLKYKAGYEQGKFEGSLIPYKEPQKTVVPQFVADWIETCKENNIISLSGAFEYAKEEVDTWLSDWKNQEIFASAWIFGYEVEKEKKYTVELTKTQQYLYCIDNDFTFVTYARPDDNPRLYHTRKELEEAGFGEVFDSPLFEVEEVEE